MTPEFCSWAAQRLLEQLRTGEVPGPTPAHFVWDPLLEETRKAIRPTDHLMVRRLASEATTVMWGALLSRGFLDDTELTDELIRAFEKESEVERSIGLVHHLAARPLDDAQFNQLFSWLRSKASSLIEDQKQKFGGPSGADQLRRRLRSDDPGMAAKRWLYMYSVHALPPAEARALLEHACDDHDPRVAAAARHSKNLSVPTEP